MSWITRSVRGACLAVCVTATTIGAAAGPASAAEEYVKYYAVTTSYQQAPENLTEIAGRFLGDRARSAEILNLNVARRQPDGGQLSDPSRLRAGWLLVLPWDAVGEGVKYGALPDKAPSTRVEPQTKKGEPPRKARKPVPQAVVAAASSVPSKPPKKTAPPKNGQCAVVAASSSRSDWAGLRLAANQAWPQSRGKGQMVAVVDSGVDGGVPALSGHVAVGMDMVSGSGRGDTDCLGSGTAMAGLIAAQPNKGSSVTGIAPEATVMPVRVTSTDAKVQPADGASAIEAAVRAGATVIALGGFVDTSKPDVAAAMMNAVDRDVLVVTGAPLGSVPVDPKAKLGAGVLRVGGVGVDSQRVGDYRSGSIDLVAPGINVNSVGITGVGSFSGSGTQYAVALVAGVAALVRSAYPDLTAEQVAHRMQVTSEKMSDVPPPDGRFGWGMINPAAAVTKVLPEEVGDNDSGAAGHRAANLAAGKSGGRSTLLAVVTLVALAAILLLVFRIRRLLREPVDDDGDDDGPGPVTAGPPVPPGALPPASMPRAPSVSRKPELPPPPDDADDPDGEPEMVPGTSRDSEVAVPVGPKASIGAKSSQPRPDTP